MRTISASCSRRSNRAEASKASLLKMPAADGADAGGQSARQFVLQGLPPWVVQRVFPGGPVAARAVGLLVKPERLLDKAPGLLDKPAPAVPWAVSSPPAWALSAMRPLSPNIRAVSWYQVAELRSFWVRRPARLHISRITRAPLPFVSSMRWSYSAATTLGLRGTAPSSPR